MKGTYFFSFRRPYSWLASMGLKQRIDAGEQLELVPFWEPDEKSLTLLKAKGGSFPYRAMSDAKHRYILNDVSRLTKKFSLSFCWPVDPKPWWEVAHLGYLKAHELGVGMPFFWQVYQARWQDKLDISDPAVIRKICASAGISSEFAELIAKAPEDTLIREQGADILYRIYREDIFGVPMFTKKRKQFWGLDRLNDFLSLLDKPLLTAEELPITNGYPLDFDHAGGCG